MHRRPRPRRAAFLLLAGAALVGAPAVIQAQPAQATSCERASSLGFAAGYESVESVRRLLDAGVGVNCVTSGQTALILAARWNKPENVKLLLSRGADPDIEDRAGSIALEVAAQQGYANVTSILAAHMGVPDPLAPTRRARPTPAPGAVPAPPPAPRPAPPVRAEPPGPGRDMGQRPGAPPGARPEARPAAPNATPPTQWAPFGSYRPGERVQFWTAAGWKTGVVREVGPAGDYGRGNAGTYERKYVIADDRWGGAGEARDWGLVAGLTREPFWTAFFVGEWALGEVMAVNDRTDGRELYTEYSYHTATEALRVKADGSYEWKDMAGRVRRGQWEAASDGPGIVLRSGAEGRDWTLRNETNAIEEKIRGIETARLTAPGVMSIAAKRPLAGRGG
jgi:hypothetical protein